MITQKEQIEELKKQLKIYKKLSIYDELTGIYNKRKLEEDLIKYCKLNERYNTNFTILMLDIDRFKDINDTKGHLIGDKILKQMARTLKTTIRLTDKLYRLSGDEFILVVTRYKIEEFIKRIKNILKRINIEVSIGHCDISKNCLEIVDKLMYEDKRSKTK